MPSPIIRRQVVALLTPRLVRGLCAAFAERKDGRPTGDSTGVQLRNALVTLVVGSVLTDRSGYYTEEVETAHRVVDERMRRYCPATRAFLDARQAAERSRRKADVRAANKPKTFFQGATRGASRSRPPRQQTAAR